MGNDLVIQLFGSERGEMPWSMQCQKKRFLGEGCEWKLKRVHYAFYNERNVGPILSFKLEKNSHNLLPISNAISKRKIYLKLNETLMPRSTCYQCPNSLLHLWVCFLRIFNLDLFLFLTSIWQCSPSPRRSKTLT